VLQAKTGVEKLIKGGVLELVLVFHLDLQHFPFFDVGVADHVFG